MLAQFRWLLVSALAISLAGVGFARFMESQIQNQAAISHTVNMLPHRAPAIPQTYLGTNLVPPTNKWYSALAFSNQPIPVYAYPVSYSQTSTGFSVSNPPVTSSANVIFATHVPDITVNLGTNTHIVSAYDDLSVQVDQQTAAGLTMAQTRITHGSPYVFTKILNHTTVTIAASSVWKSIGHNAYSAMVGKQLYGVYSSAPITANGSQLSVAATSGTNVAIFALPNTRVITTYVTAAEHPITGTAVSYKQQSNKLVTTYSLNTKAGTTLFATTPEMNVSGHASAGNFNTILGNQTVLIGTNFDDIQTTPTMPSPALNTSKLTSSQRNDLIQKLQTDAGSLQFTATDSYFGGKELYRAANLLELAYNLNQTQLASSIQSKLSAQLDLWLDPSGASKRTNEYFYYDTSYHGVVGDTPSFGSDMFNDHHFHYGYFIYAAAILARHDPTFMAQHGTMVNVLIDDIASSQASSDFPKLRMFDSYVGHSWASGNGTFTDGNNQESSSEAVNAWYATYLWSQVTHDQPLALESTWLYAHETTAATNSYLTSPKATATNGPSYMHNTVGIVWGGKLDYSTFFSARPQAVLGIQLLPMSPGQAYLKNTNIQAILKQVIPNTSDISGQFGDEMLMYEALENPALALKQASNVAPSDIDSGNSETYFYAWLYTHLNQ